MTEAPLPLAGGVGGGHVARRPFLSWNSPSPNPSRKREGDSYPTRVQVTVRQNTATQPFIVSLSPFTRRCAL